MTIKAGDRVVRRVTGEHGTVTAVQPKTDERPPLGRFYGDELGEQGYVHMGEFELEGGDGDGGPETEAADVTVAGEDTGAGEETDPVTDSDATSPATTPEKEPAPKRKRAKKAATSKK
jgi:hypothetical protein